MSDQHKMKNILVIHGPNLNLLGEREPEVYGAQTLKDVNREISKIASSKNLTVRFYQSNHEGKLIDCIHKHRHWTDGLVINPGAFTHYSYALRDAIAAVGKPAVEVHLSDIHKREDFRKISVIQPVCIKQISGKGIQSYIEGIEILLAQNEVGCA
jgi:3-dehydroquinate dehydratase-2